MNNRHFLLFLLMLLSVVFFCSTCLPERITEDEMIQYLKQPRNGLIKTFDQNDFKFSIVYHPGELMAYRESKLNGVSNKRIRDSLTSYYENYVYFLLTLSRDGQELLSSDVSDSRNFDKRINQLAFNMSNYIQLVTSNKDTVPLMTSQFSRVFGETGYNTVLLAFYSDKILKAKDFSVEMDDLGMGTGKVRFTFTNEDILRIPHLIL